MISELNVNVIRPSTTNSLEIQGLNLPTYLGDIILTRNTVTSDMIPSQDVAGGYVGINVELQLQEIATGLRASIPFSGGSSPYDTTQIADLFKALYRSCNPIGKVIQSYESLTAPPPGTVPLDGSTYSRAGKQAELWEWAQARSLVITDAAWMADRPMVGMFSDGDGTTNFRVPDLRGAFIRGNAGSTIFYTGSPQGLGLDNGRSIGSKQLDEIKAHTHTLPQESGGASNNPSLTDTTGVDEGPYGSPVTGSTGGTETRPINVSLSFFMYY